MDNNLIFLKDVLKSVDHNSCPLRINMHSHTTFSDGSLTPYQLISQAHEIGLQHLAVTDHHNTQAYGLMKSWLDRKNIKDMSLWTGIEISCLLKKCLVHILGLGFDIGSKSIRPYCFGESVFGELLKAESVIEAIHKANGIAVLAHPGRYRINYKELIIESKRIGIDGIETWYDYEMATVWTPTLFVCEDIDKLVKSLGLISSCGTDTHGLSLKCR